LKAGKLSAAHSRSRGRT